MQRRQCKRTGFHGHMAHYLFHMRPGAMKALFSQQSKQPWICWQVPDDDTGTFICQETPSNVQIILGIHECTGQTWVRARLCMLGWPISPIQIVTPYRVAEVSVTMLNMKGFVIRLIHLIPAVKFTVVPDFHQTDIGLHHHK